MRPSNIRTKTSQHSFQASRPTSSATKMQLTTLTVILCAIVSPVIPNATAFLLSRQLFHKCDDAKGDQGLVACNQTYNSNTSRVEMNCCRRRWCLDVSTLPQLLGYCDSLRCDETREVTLNLTGECPRFRRKPGIVCFEAGVLI